MPKKTARKASPTEDDKELQKKYLYLQIFKQQLAALVEEKKAVDERLVEMSTTINALQKLADVPKGEEIWSTLGSGTFVKSDIKDKENVLVAVGAGVVVKESREKGVEILSSRLEQLQKIDSELTEEINRLAMQASQLEQQLQHEVENR